MAQTRIAASRPAATMPERSEPIGMVSMRTRASGRPRLEAGEAGAGAREPVPLAVADAAAPQRARLLLAFDALGDQLRADARSHLEQRMHQLLLDEAAVDVLDEREIDLDELGLHLGQSLQRRVPGADVVDGDEEALPPQRLEAAAERLEIVDRGALGDLQDEVARLEVRLRQRRAERVVGEAGRSEGFRQAVQE